MGEEAGRVFHTQLFQLGGNLGVGIGMLGQNLVEGSPSFFCLQGNLPDDLVTVGNASLCQQDVGRLRKDSAPHLSAGIRQIPGHVGVVSLKAGHHLFHAGHRHGKACQIVGHKALAGRIGQVPLVLGNLVHKEGHNTGGKGLPQGLYVLAVPGIALLGHGGGAHLGGAEILEDLANLGALEVAQIVGQVGDDAEGHVALQKEAQQVLRLHQLGGMLGGLQSQVAQVAALQIFWVTDNHGGAVVGSHRTGQLSPQLLGTLLNLQDGLAQAGDILGDGKAKGDGNGVLTVGATNLGSLGITGGNVAEASLQLL